MTARALVYARGGGHGHAMRGAILSRMLRERGHDTLLLVAPGSTRWLGDEPHRCVTIGEVGDHELLFTDTFPRGWQGELDDQVLARFSQRTLVARYNRDQTYSTTGYDRVLAPYPEGHDEWPRPLPGARHTGWLVRPAPMQVEAGGSDFALIDPAQRVPAAILERLGAFALRAGMRLVHLTTTPRRLVAKKLLTIGAGYHTVYEHVATRADLRFFPLTRRWDDQHRRARRVRRAVTSLADVLEWLVAPTRCEPICAVPETPVLP